MEREGSAGDLGEPAVTEFVAGLRGSVVRRGEDGYDDARSVWNAAHDRRPALVVRCAGVADVVRTVHLARSEGLRLAVRGGGHSMAGFSTCDDGVVLDLGSMKGIRVDAARGRVTAQGGCVWRDLDLETQHFGLAVTGGLVSSTGIAGFTLGGGIGWLSRRCGLAADNLVSAEVVTADGTVLVASPHENSELFWGLQGGGGNFGVVTSFEFALHDIGTTVFAGATLFPDDQAVEVLHAYSDATALTPRELTTLVKLTTAPPLPFVPPELRGRRVVMVVGCWSGDPALGQSATESIRSLGSVLLDTFATRPYLAWQQALDPLFPRGLHNYTSSVFLPDLDTPRTDAAVAAFTALPNDTTELLVHQLGGGVSDPGTGQSAFSVRDQPYLANAMARTPDPQSFPEVTRWARATCSALAPDAPSYVNFTGEASQRLTRSSYPPDTLRRLVALKDRYDPGNLFRLNQNVRPSREGPHQQEEPCNRTATGHAPSAGAPTSWEPR